MNRADEGMGYLLQYEHVAWYEAGCVKILDRRVYPMETTYVICHTHEQVAQAIADMVTQSGGPFSAAAMGMVLAAYEVRGKAKEEVLSYMEKAAYRLSHARPTTAAKMQEITDTCMNIVKETLANHQSDDVLIQSLQAYAIDRMEKNYRKYDKIGKFLCEKIPQNGTIMTQCFAETVLGTLFRECQRTKKHVKVICPETRPYFQGARLTASVAADMGMDVTVISDNMAAYTMKQKHVDILTSAADVITMDGSIINKVGTFQLAYLADYFHIPYYVSGTPNPHHQSADDVIIEERDSELVLHALDVKITKECVKGYYPAFDITPRRFVSGVVTDKGIFKPDQLAKYYE